MYRDEEPDWARSEDRPHKKQWGGEKKKYTLEENVNSIGFHLRSLVGEIKEIKEILARR
jgi:hypothetical protein